jgi:hypothetical protein
MGKSDFEIPNLISGISRPIVDIMNIHSFVLKQWYSTKVRKWCMFFNTITHYKFALDENLGDIHSMIVGKYFLLHCGKL